jgi:hypothetical protein
VLARSAEIRFSVDLPDAGQMGGVGVFKLDEGGWTEIASHWDELRGELVSFVDSFGTYQVQASSSGVPHGDFRNVTLRGPFPNPFTSEARMILDLPVDAAVGVRVYDAAGRLVSTVMEARRLSARSYILTWDGRASGRNRSPSGVYLIRVNVGERTLTRRVVLAR